MWPVSPSPARALLSALAPAKSPEPGGDVEVADVESAPLLRRVPPDPLRARAVVCAPSLHTRTPLFRSRFRSRPFRRK